VRPEGLHRLKKCNDLRGTRTRDIPACSIAPQPSTLPRGTSAAIWSITKFGPTAHRHPRSSPLSASMHRSLSFCHSLNSSSLLRGCSAPPAILPRSPQLVSKWWPFSFDFNRGKRKVGLVGDDSNAVLVKKNPGENEM
jgi:hypothetical protein